MSNQSFLPALEGVLETSLYVSDLETSLRFYSDILGLRPLYCEPGRMVSLSVNGKHVLLLFLKESSLKPIQIPGAGTIPPHDGNGQLHLAFGVSSEDLVNWQVWLNQHRISIEAEMKWDRGGHSLYFRDPDNHLLELVTPGVWEIR
jgi:catechol 2,3-dioxygenase-like lactoylglutathione lyase family enzyme